MVAKTEFSELRAIFNWFVNIIGKKQWETRRASVQRHISSVIKPQLVQRSLQEETSRYLYKDDPFAWYLYLSEALLEHPKDYEFAQGARIIPIFLSLGRDLHLLSSIDGVYKRTNEIVNNKNPDGGIFELLVALAYKRNGWKHVYLLPKNSSGKTPDIRIVGDDIEYFIECKKMSKDSDYALKERKKWLTLYEPIKDYVLENKLSLIIEIIFHCELVTLDDSFLIKNLIPKLKFITQPCILMDDETLTVKVDYTNYEKMEKKLTNSSINFQLVSIKNLVVGPTAPSKGITLMYLINNNSSCAANRISFAAGAIWSCDSIESLKKKARYFKRHLAQAVDQLPPKKPGIVHIGLESIDGYDVEELRHERNLESIQSFNEKTKNIHRIYCHIFDAQVPPDKNWSFDETVIEFTKDNRIKSPLKFSSIVPPFDTKPISGAEWIR